MKRRQYLFSNSSIPSRTLRRMRERQRLRSLISHSPIANVINSVTGDVVFSSSSNSNQASAIHGALLDNLHEHLSQDGSSISSSEENQMHNLYEDCDASSRSSCSGDNGSESSSASESDEEGGFEANMQSANDTWPEEDDMKFWETPSGHDIYLSTPLSPSTQTTRGDALLMCLALGLRHSLAWTVIVDILKMINSLFGQEVVKATKYFFLKYMEAGKGKVTYHMYCPYCHRYLGSRDELHDASTVCRCGKSLKDKKAAKSFFLTLSMEEQIRDLLRDKTFVDALQYRFSREKCQENAYEDIFDGELYSELSGPGGVLSYWYNMSYTFNTDGFPVGGKSGKQTCWPIYVQINELPPKMRSKFMLLAGIHVGRHDPNMQLYLHPFVQEANDLATEGIHWYFNNKKIISKLIPLAGCVDTPARSKILNMSLFSGAYGCTICPNNPESLKVGVRYTLPLNAMNERTHEDILVDAARAHANKTAVRNKKNRRVRGVKGPSPLHSLMYFDVVKGMRPDIMHSVLLGNGRHHVSVLHGNPGKQFYIGADVTMLAINNRLLHIRPPSSLPRATRDFLSFGSWKANEWLPWLLFYVVPCLYDIVPNEFVAHISMLSSALHIFLSKSISVNDLEQAHILALRYAFLFQEYFGKEEMVINIHLLLHMKNSIRFLGPSWTNMAFSFEGANKQLLELKKGSSSIAQEIASKYLTFRALPLLCDKFASSEETVNFCQNLSGRPLLKSISRLENAVFVGKGKQTTLDDEETECLFHKVLSHHKEVLAFDKFIKDEIRYSTASYCQSSKRDDSYISVSGESKARIQKIVQCSEGSGHSVYLLVRELELDDTPLFDDEFGRASPLLKVVGDGKLLAIKPDDISGQCVAMFIESGNFICEIPYGCYGDS